MEHHSFEHYEILAPLLNVVFVPRRTYMRILLTLFLILVIPTLALGMEPTYEELKSKVSKLEEENKALIEFNESNVEKLKHMADLEFSNQAYETANPKFAIEMLDKHNKDIYLYACKTSES